MSYDQLSRSVRLKIEVLCEEFRQTPNDPQRIDSFLLRVGDEPWRATLLQELLEIDLSEKVAEREEFPNSSLTLAYRSHLDGLKKASLQQLFELEFRLRCGQGDKPTVSQFLQWTEHPELERPLYRVIHGLQPVNIMVHEPGQDVRTVPFDQPTMFGRRTRPTTVGGRHVGVSDSRYVAREQLRLSRPSVQTFRIENVGKRLSVFVDRTRRIAPGGHVEVGRFDSVSFLDVWLFVHSSEDE